MKLKIAALSLLVGSMGLLAACGPDPDMPLRKHTAETKATALKENDRVSVARVGVFEDDLAYGSRRGVYIILDAKTGKEYLGISGVGISETGCHMVSTGKSSYCVSDER